MPELTDITQSKISVKGYNGTIEFQHRRTTGYNSAELVILINKRVAVKILRSATPEEQNKLLDIAERIDLDSLNALSK